MQALYYSLHIIKYIYLLLLWSALKQTTSGSQTMSDEILDFLQTFHRQD